MAIRWPKSWVARILLGVVSLVALVLLLLAGLVAAILTSHGIDARQVNRANRQAAERALTALERYRAQHGRYPPALSDVFPEYFQPSTKPPEKDPPGNFYYRASPDGQRFWIAYDERVPGIFLPSDLVAEYDSKLHQWRTMDISQAESAKEPEH